MTILDFLRNSWRIGATREYGDRTWMMAKITNITLVDDLDGGRADETVTFTVDGKEFEIDLSAQHASELREVFAPFVGAARRAPSGSGRRNYARVASSAGKTREENAAIREWALSAGFQVSERGRIPSNVLEAYANRGASTREPEAAPDAPREAAPEPTPDVSSEAAAEPQAESEPKPKRRTRKKVAAAS
ncbi:Lsr2 dimerization domain-containing protein [Pseudonocardia terrae]|uniref:Lsr2 dimerization domain-containing protein n=1 Tax=Pseudonocardia terrae TaxID=2905831 RepID=UPI0027DF5DB0|nr:histone-like nucleoid-structuring protein Lsr2 [Pseudonocardia terrae]